MKWPWSKKVSAPQYAEPDHEASHEAARILDAARMSVLREYPRDCHGAWGVLFNAQRHVEKVCRKRLSE